MPAALKRSAAAGSMARSKVGQQRNRLGRAPVRIQEGLLVGIVPVVLEDEVDAERHHVGFGVLGENGERPAEPFGRLGAGAPQVEGVRGLETGIEESCESLLGIGRDGSESK